jgi:hypothetical protein
VRQSRHARRGERVRLCRSAAVNGVR